MILLTFLGNSSYSDATYKFPDGEGESSKVFFIQTAVLQMLKKEGVEVEKVLVITTETVMRTRRDYPRYSDGGKGLGCDFPNNFEALKKEVELSGFDTGIFDEPVIIPEDASPQAISETFARITSRLEGYKANSKLEVVVDITHSFRFIPIVMLSILRLLEAKDKVQLERVLYGQYESTPKKIVDLQSFVLLADFAQGVRMFNKYGLGEPLGEILERLGRQIDDNNMIQVGQRFQRVALYFRYGLVLLLGEKIHERDCFCPWSQGCYQRCRMACS